MRKLYTYAIMLLLICSAGCTRYINDDGKDIDVGGYTVFDTNLESVEIFPGSNVAKTWEESSEIGVFGSDLGANEKYVLVKGSSGKTQAVAYGKVVEGETVQAYFPYDAAVSRQADGGITCELPRIQAYEPDVELIEHYLNYCPKAYASLSDDGALKFSYPMGVMKVSFDFDEILNITSIALRSSGKLSGRLSITEDGSINTSEVSSSDIQLDLGGNAIPTKTGGALTPFFFVLPPGTYSDVNLTIEVISLEETFEVALFDLSVPRINGKDFRVASVEVTSSTLPSFDVVNGYHE